MLIRPRSSLMTAGAAFLMAVLMAISAHAVWPRIVISPTKPQVATYAKDRFGTKAGDGECATLAANALRAAKCKTTSDFGVNGSSADYVWGIKIGEVNQRSPDDWLMYPWERAGYRISTGDVIQFKSVVFKGRTNTGTYTKTYPHHTAIVEKYSGDIITILHQNVGSGTDAQRRKVQRGTLNINDFYSGHLWTYRPVVK